MNSVFLLLALNCLQCKSIKNAHANLRKRKLKISNSPVKKNMPPILPEALSASASTETPTLREEHSDAPIDHLKVSNEADVDGTSSKMVDNHQTDYEENNSDFFHGQGEMNKNDQNSPSKVIITESSTGFAPELPYDDVRGGLSAELDIANPVMNPQHGKHFSGDSFNYQEVIKKVEEKSLLKTCITEFNTTTKVELSYDDIGDPIPVELEIIDTVQKKQNGEENSSDSVPGQGEMNENDQNSPSKVIITESSTGSVPELPYDDVRGGLPAELDIANPVMDPHNSESTDTELIQNVSPESNLGNEGEKKKEDDDTFTSPFETNDDNDDVDEENLIFDYIHEYYRNSRNGMP